MAFDPANTDSSKPAAYAESVTPSDTVDLPNEARSLYIGTGGDIVVVTVAGDEVTFVGMLSGSILPVRVKQVKATGTVATDIIGLR